MIGGREGGKTYPDKGRDGDFLDAVVLVLGEAVHDRYDDHAAEEEELRNNHGPVVPAKGFE